MSGPLASIPRVDSPLSLEPADSYDNKLGATLTVVRMERVRHTGRYLIRTGQYSAVQPTRHSGVGY